MDKNDGIYEIKGGFNVLSEFYDSDELNFFLDSSKLMVNELKLSGVKSILDLATGTGHTAFELSKKYTDSKIIGIDISESMLKKAEMKKSKNSNIEFKIHDIEALEFLEYKYDLITCSFGTYFIKDTVRLFKNVLQKLNRNGSFVLTCFAEESFMPFSVEYFANLREKGIIQNYPKDFSSLNEKYVSDLVIAGFSNVKTIDKRMQYKIKKAEEWWTVIWGTGFRSFLEELDYEDLEQFKSYHLEKIDEMLKRGTDTYNLNILIMIGEVNPC
ncbi:class I SAM-dependent methyltransferase [Acetivibrio mesophilus]|nr:class I SAM-dependent methyltransferase [Acetivibrio mesophilus]HHV30575.1 methyltransferase domain-containing protein [Clostridium sp.]HOA79442.1 methyltransferase domain-containing protein [Defluviitaleaceae bacterium]